ncbi:Hypothetical protein I595_487 [Croceitalea dokdonensis DOKDO 023]|uniref:Uncharacterized protein n=1 Tax=Croceitalea dokdonensis DOKDO 023 TaxID=1300341 RepID=A0A0P7B2F0_9FLAO|nr:ATP-binding protein [Croceitalea dokdonensis]KPM33584.1 Hypothetical protein I595_487 [Croceitalea dokdonensis DOKDO 023]
MKYEDNTYVTRDGVYYEGIIREIKRSRNTFQPIYEAFTNALEAIKIREKENNGFNGKILIKIHSTQNTDGSLTFSKMHITDNGIGFNDEEFDRFNTYKDFTKGFKNLGSGRIQYTHFFDTTRIKSIYESNGGYREREFVVSKNKNFLQHKSIVFHKKDVEIEAEASSTTLTFEGLLDSNLASYHNLNDEILKDALLRRYIQYFCLNKKELPEITIEHYAFNERENISKITESDIPEIDKSEDFQIHYSKVSPDASKVESADEFETFTLNSYKLDKSFLKHNDLKLTSKNEVVQQFDINLVSLAKNDVIEGSHFLFLVSSDYLDNKDTNERGEFHIPRFDEFQDQLNMFSDREIILDDLEYKLGETVWSLYPEIEKIQEKHLTDLNKLKEMFLLPDDFDSDIDISINDSSKKILEKFYTVEAKKKAELDSNIKDSMDRLNHLDTTSDDYSALLNEEIDRIVRVIPQQNRVELTHYVARRKLVLDLFSLILNKKLIVQNDGSRNNNEELLHNLIFEQKSTITNKSDLWIINEDFIYFQGVSEFQLSDIKYKGKNIIREDLSDKESEYITSLGQKRLDKRPDILLFPKEEKCIIIEFKSLDTNVSDHLNQINHYATLLRNFSIPEMKLTTFYGYLIGEQIEPHDVRSHDADFIPSYEFDYLFRPAKKIAGMFNNEGKDGSLYTEVLKYSTLLERAKNRNEIFIKKLTGENTEEAEDDETLF